MRFLEEVFNSNLRLLLRGERPHQHIRHFRDKMVVYFHNDPLLCIIFPSSLKSVTSDWYYSLLPPSLHNFEEVTKAFLTQYASRQEAKKKSYYLLSLRQSEKLKSYISFFQRQLAKVFNCGEDVSALIFISGLLVSHSPYKHLLKHTVTRMSKILSRAQPYIQLEKAMKNSFNHTAKHSDVGEKSKSHMKPPLTPRSEPRET